MTILRRDFLRFASAGPLIFGLGDLRALAAVSQDAPAWWKSALGRMKDLGRPGLVFIGPKGSDDLDNLGFALRDLLESGDSRAREIFCAAVVICLHSEVAPACLPEGSIPGVVVLEPTGRVAEKSDLKMESLQKPEAFDAAFSPLIHGKGDARLAAEADRVRSGLSESEKAAMADLDADEITTRERATRTLAPRTEALMALLVFERRASPRSERSGRVRQLIDARFEASDEKSAGPRLPFGAAFVAGRGGCAAELEEGTSVQCGMGRLEGKGQRFLRFLKS